MLVTFYNFDTVYVSEYLLAWILDRGSIRSSNLLVSYHTSLSKFRKATLPYQPHTRSVCMVFQDHLIYSETNIY